MESPSTDRLDRALAEEEDVAILPLTIAEMLQGFKWNPAKEEFSGDEEANRLRSRTNREPWGG